MFALSLLSVAAATPIRQELVDAVNQANAGWTAKIQERFDGASEADVKRLLGTILGPSKIPMPHKEPFLMDEPFPSSFDTREKWPECKDTINHIRDQSICGSCWAFAPTESFTDRVCIASGGKHTTPLAATDTLACCDLKHDCWAFGCDGGQPASAWLYFQTDGIVTGGDYDDNGKSDTCWPYPLQPCAHHGEQHGMKWCKELGNATTPTCRKTCSNTGYKTEFAQDLHKAETSYEMNTTEEIKHDLMNYGPVTVGFSVYEDFMNYDGGIYVHTTGKELGGHAVKIVGWGTSEEGTEYWIVANSWNVNWGEDGFFRIKVGECGIEGGASGGHVKSTTVFLV